MKKLKNPLEDILVVLELFLKGGKRVVVFVVDDRIAVRPVMHRTFDDTVVPPTYQYQANRFKRGLASSQCGQKRWR